MKLLIFVTLFVFVKSNKYDENIFFNYYNASGELTHVFNLVENTSYPYDESCNPMGKYGIVVFGWQVECTQDYAKLLITNLQKHRGGCVICMDYSKFANLRSYIRLRRQYKNITSILTQKLQKLENDGFNPDNGFIYGFSFGGIIALEAAKDYGTRRIHSIDICDLEGSGFDVDERREPSPNYRISAKNVQCIHTSKNSGTKHIDSCHQDWILGHCGTEQDASTYMNLGSHVICNLFYNSAFENDFLAVKNPENCTAKNEVVSWPEGFKMGYTETRKSEFIRGQLFALTFATPPFNINLTPAAVIQPAKNPFAFLSFLTPSKATTTSTTPKTTSTSTDITSSVTEATTAI